MGWNPRVVYSDGSDEARFNAQVAMEALKNYVQPRLVTAGDLNNIEIVDTSNERHHGSGWPFLYDEKYDKLYIGNTQAFHSSLIESMGQEKMNDIWLRYYQEDKDSGEYDEEQPASVLGGRYDPENTYEPYMFYDFDTARGQADKWRIKELIDQAMNYIPHEFDEEEDDHVAKVATSPINDYEYQWHPLTEAELAGYRSGLPANERVK